MSKKMQDYLEEQEKKRQRKSLPKSPKKQRKSQELTAPERKGDFSHSQAVVLKKTLVDVL